MIVLPMWQIAGFDVQLLSKLLSKTVNNLKCSIGCFDADLSCC